MTSRLRVAKEQQSLYLEVELVAALRGIAEQNDTSVSDVTNELLRLAIEQYRAENVLLQRAKVLEQALPMNLVDPPDDHPIFGGKSPVPVVTERRWHPRAYAPE